MASQFQLHVERWKNCDRCPLHEERSRVCLYRGHIPCDILFIGQAPGESEDVFGQPFVGPAGQMLDYDGTPPGWVQQSGANKLRCGFTNLVCCIPVDIDGYDRKERAPSEIEVETCSLRLREVIKIAQPRLIVAVGKLAEAWIPHLVDLTSDSIEMIEIAHPSYLLKSVNIAQRVLLIKRIVVKLKEAVNKLCQQPLSTNRPSTASKSI